MLKPWLVCSPEYGEVIPITDEGQGPMEYGCDVVHVLAETRRDALLMGVLLFRQQGARYLDRYSDENPYAGVKVESQICHAHGMETIIWNHDHFECTTCELAYLAEAERERDEADAKMSAHQRRTAALREAGMDETNTRASREQMRDSGHYHD